MRDRSTSPEGGQARDSQARELAELRSALAEERSRYEMRIGELEQQLRQERERFERLNRAVDQERRRIARLFHDDLQQLVASARLQAQILQSSIASGRPLEAIGRRLDEMLEEAIRKARELSHELNLEAPAAEPADRPLPAQPVAEPAGRKRTKTRIRVLLADDHRTVRQGLATLLNEQPGIRVVGEASTGQEAVEMVRRLDPDVVLMDVSMPDMDGIEATRLIKAEMPRVRVIGLSMYDKRRDIVEELKKAGADTCLSKGALSETVISAIRGK
jgi:CheY-like chemotaxis protein